MSVLEGYEIVGFLCFGDFFSLDFKREDRKLRLVTHSNLDVSKSEALSVEDSPERPRRFRFRQHPGGTDQGDRQDPREP
jgi:hypothetical protein